jgi:hypothetical protein
MARDSSHQPERICVFCCLRNVSVLGSMEEREKERKEERKGFPYVFLEARSLRSTT